MFRQENVLCTLLIVNLQFSRFFVSHTIQPQLKSIHISQYEESAALGIIKM